MGQGSWKTVRATISPGTHRCDGCWGGHIRRGASCVRPQRGDLTSSHGKWFQYTQLGHCLQSRRVFYRVSNKDGRQITKHNLRSTGSRMQNAILIPVLTQRSLLSNKVTTFASLRHKSGTESLLTLQERGG